MDRLAIEKEEKLRKKLFRIGRMSGWSVGLGIGLLVVRFVAPAMMGSAGGGTNAALGSLGGTMIFYGAVQLAAIMFLRRYAVPVSLVMTYLVMPAVGLKLAMGMM